MNYLGLLHPLPARSTRGTTFSAKIHAKASGLTGRKYSVPSLPNQLCDGESVLAVAADRDSRGRYHGPCLN